jgi:hypothetical protein
LLPWRPPLTRELFDPRDGSFGPILDFYPGAKKAAAEIRVRLIPRPEAKKAFRLEKYLREELKDECWVGCPALSSIRA